MGLQLTRCVIRACLILIALLALGKASAQSAAAQAQQPAARAGSPIDVVGIRLGMPLEQAIEIAKAHNPKLKWYAPVVGSFDAMPGAKFTVAVYAQEEGRAGNMPIVRETLYIEAAPGPTPAVVTGILRNLRFDGAELARASVVRNLEEKYGSAYERGQSSEAARLWHFDSSGKAFHPPTPCRANYTGRSMQAAGADELGAVMASAHFQKNVQQLPHLQREAPNCRALVWATFVTYLQNKDLVSALSVYATDEVLRTERFTAMVDHLKRLSQTGQQRQTQEAERRGAPKF